MKRWLTPENSPGDLTVMRAISLPADEQWLALVGGALSELANPDNYEQYGSVTPDECSEFFMLVLSEFYGV